MTALLPHEVDERPYVVIVFRPGEAATSVLALLALMPRCQGWLLVPIEPRKKGHEFPDVAGVRLALCRHLSSSRLRVPDGPSNSVQIAPPASRLHLETDRVPPEDMAYLTIDDRCRPCRKSHQEAVFAGAPTGDDSRRAPFDEVPAVAIPVGKDSHHAVWLVSRLLPKLDAPAPVGPVVAPEVIGFQE